VNPRRLRSDDHACHIQSIDAFLAAFEAHLAGDEEAGGS
jgi:hypothetical protein